jgi:hypothetical protein
MHISLADVDSWVHIPLSLVSLVLMAGGKELLSLLPSVHKLRLKVLRNIDASTSHIGLNRFSTVPTLVRQVDTRVDIALPASWIVIMAWSEVMVKIPTLVNRQDLADGWRLFISVDSLSGKSYRRCLFSSSTLPVRTRASFNSTILANLSTLVQVCDYRKFWNFAHVEPLHDTFMLKPFLFIHILSPEVIFGHIVVFDPEIVVSLMVSLSLRSRRDMLRFALMLVILSWLKYRTRIHFRSGMEWNKINLKLELAN